MIFLQSLCFRLATTHRLCDGNELVVTFRCLQVTWGYLRKLLKCMVQRFINELEAIEALWSIGRSNTSNKICLPKADLWGNDCERSGSSASYMINLVSQASWMYSNINNVLVVRNVAPRNFLKFFKEHLIFIR